MSNTLMVRPFLLSRRGGLVHFATAIVTVLTVLGFLPNAALATSVNVRIDLSDQRMSVEVGGKPAYHWAVSTARRGYRTPTGTFRPTRLERTWFSRKYDDAPMPFSIFFQGGYAIHGTNELRNLGRPVSRGCIRLHPDNARRLFSLVQKYGAKSTRVTITG